MADGAPELKKTVTTFFITLAVALVASTLVGVLVKQSGASGGIAERADLAVFAGVIFLDPIALYRDRAPLRKVAVKLAVSAAIVTVLLMIMGGVTNVPEAEDAGPAVEQSKTMEDSFRDALWITLPMLLILPLIFFAPNLEKLIGGKRTEGLSTAEDMQIGAVFPIFMMFHMLFHLAILGALYLLGVSAWMAGGIFLLGILLTVSEVWIGGPGDFVEDTESWGPRPESAKEAWQGLGKAIRSSMASGLFLGAMMYLTLMAGLPLLLDGAFAADEIEPIAMIWSLLKAVGVICLVFALLTIVANVIVAAAVIALMRMKGLDPLSTEELLKQSLARLFGGGMQYVRPDTDRD